MADTDSYIRPQKLGSQLPLNHANPSKFFTRFMYKAFIAIIFLVLLPLFPIQPPEFINRSFHTTSGELLQLLFVGIAVSYGLFSRRNDETEKEHNSTFDNAQSYVNRFLQVSSVFDDETESPSGFDDKKVQTWNSQYYRCEPVVVIAQESSVLEERRGVGSKTGEKPLLLPVRSLKSGVSESVVIDTTNESSDKSASFSRSSANSGSTNNATKTTNGEFGGSDSFNLEEVEEYAVLPSPIPWRSRAGRLEMKENFDGSLPYSQPSSMEESEFKKLESRSSRSKTSWSSRSNSPSLSPPNDFQELTRRKNHGESSPPLAPPLPPPFVHRSLSMKSNSSVTSDEVSSQKELKRSFRSVPKNLNCISREEGSVSRTRTENDGSLMGKTIPTVRATEPVAGAMETREEFGEDVTNGKADKRLKEVAEMLIEKTGRTNREEEMSKTDLSEYEVEEKNEVVETMIVETDDESEVGYNSYVGYGGPDVNKKAEEFIAKFREQIGLQRIESITKSSGRLDS